MVNYTLECKTNSKCLESKANGFSLLYVICILISASLGIFSLGTWIKNEQAKFIVGAIALMTTVLLLIFKKEIECVQGYRELSIEFKNLETDFITNRNSQANVDRLKNLRKKLSAYPIGSFVKKFCKVK